MAFFMYARLYTSTKPADWTGAAECKHCGWLINKPVEGVWFGVGLEEEPSLETIHKVCADGVVDSLRVHLDD